MKRLLLLAACLITLTVAYPKCLNKRIAQFEQEVELVRDSLMNVGMVVVYVEDGKIVYQHSFGFKNLEKQEPMTDDCLFRIASISKSFTTVSLLQLVEQGKLSLQDDVSQLIGFQVRNPKYPDVVITLEMLLSHTSSLNDGQGYSSLKYLQPELYANWAKCYNDYAPGTGYEYCNLNLNMAGTILERVSGERFDEYVRHHVLEPLGLYGGYCVDSLDNNKFASIYHGFTEPEFNDYDYPEDKPRLTIEPYAKHFINVDEDAYAARSERLKTYQVGGYDAPMFSPTGGMKISAPDLAKYMIMHMNYGVGKVNGKPVRIIGEDLAKNMQVPRSDAEHYGLTLWETEKYSRGTVLVGHTGGAYGLRSAMFFNPAKKYGFVVISNGALESYVNSSDPTGSPDDGGNILTRTLRLMFRVFQGQK